MAEFVLVPGAWLGSWAWDEIVPALRAAGHGAYPVTLSGLADKQGVPAGQQTHVQDIVNELEGNNLRDVVLVGHSYSGIPVGQAAERIGDRLSHAVLVDSNVPIDGESFASHWYEGAAALEASIAENGGFWMPLDAADYQGQGLTTLTEPAVRECSIGEFPVTYVKCLLDAPEPSEIVAKLLTSDRWRLVTIDTGHWPMFSQPHDLARILLDTLRA